MPKGKTGVYGTGPFFRVQLPDEGAACITEEQRQLVNLDINRSEVIAELNRYLGEPLSGTKEEEVWDEVIGSVGAYLGQLKTGLPPTEGKQRQHLTRIANTARKLDELFDDADFHMSDLMHKAVHRIDGDLPYLRKCLKDLRDIDVLVDNMVKPKGRPDPYTEVLIRNLVTIWRDATGKHPGKTGDTHSEPSTRSSPFYRWCNTIADKALDTPLPRDLIDTLIDLTRSDG